MAVICLNAKADGGSMEAALNRSPAAEGSIDNLDVTKVGSNRVVITVVYTPA